MTTITVLVAVRAGAPVRGSAWARSPDGRPDQLTKKELARVAFNAYEGHRRLTAALANGLHVGLTGFVFDRVHRHERGAGFRGRGRQPVGRHIRRHVGVGPLVTFATVKRRVRKKRA
jgi:hypothetical protein